MDKDDPVISVLLTYIYESNPVAKEYGSLPLDESLLEIGVMDSFGVIELVEFIETHWGIEIADSELTVERFGGINKMSALIKEKLSLV